MLNNGRMGKSYFKYELHCNSALNGGFKSNSDIFKIFVMYLEIKIKSYFAVFTKSFSTIKTQSLPKPVVGVVTHILPVLIVSML